MNGLITIQNEQYLNDNRKSIKKLLRKFLDKSKKGQKYFKRYIQVIENASKERNGLLLWTQNNSLNEPEGYGVTIIMQDDMSNVNLIILQLYGINVKVWLEKLHEYAKLSGIKKILFQTLRKRAAVKRWLGPDWTMGPTIFERYVG